MLESWMRSYKAGGAVRRRRHGAAGGGCRWPEGRAAHGRQSACQWRPAAGAISNCPTSATMPLPVADARGARRRGDAGAGQFPARRHEGQRGGSGISASSVRTRPQSNRLGALFEVTDRSMAGRALDTEDDHLAPDGRVMEILSASTPARAGSKATSSPAGTGCSRRYEAFIHIVDSMFNQHAKWLKSSARDSVAAADRLAQLPAHLPCLATGPQRLQPSGSRLHRPSSSTRRPEVVRVYLPPDANTLLVTMRLVSAQPRLHQCHRRRQAARAAMAVEWRTAVQHCDGRHRHLGMGQQRRWRRAGRGDGLRRRRADDRDAGRGRSCCASICRISRCA